MSTRRSLPNWCFTGLYVVALRGYFEVRGERLGEGGQGLARIWPADARPGLGLDCAMGKRAGHRQPCRDSQRTLDADFW